MKMNYWRAVGRFSIESSSPTKTIIRESTSRIPSNHAKRSLPAIRMIITNQTNFAFKKDLKYEICLEDSEYSIKTYYGNDFSTLEQAKFVADLKLIELGYEVERPFLLEVKLSGKKTDGTIEDEDCYFTCISCDRPARKVDAGRCIECYNDEFDSKTGKQKAKPHIDRFLANDPIEW